MCIRDRLYKQYQLMQQHLKDKLHLIHFFIQKKKKKIEIKFQKINKKNIYYDYYEVTCKFLVDHKKMLLHDTRSRWIGMCRWDTLATSQCNILVCHTRQPSHDIDTNQVVTH